MVNGATKKTIRNSGINGVSKPFFEALLETFAREAEAGVGRIILLVLGNAGWHGAAGLKIADGVRLVYLPPYSPELQPAETLWALVDDYKIKQGINSRRAGNLLKPSREFAASCGTKIEVWRVEEGGYVYASVISPDLPPILRDIGGRGASCVAPSLRNTVTSISGTRRAEKNLTSRHTNGCLRYVGLRGKGRNISLAIGGARFEESRQRFGFFSARGELLRLRWGDSGDRRGRSGISRPCAALGFRPANANDRARVVDELGCHSQLSCAALAACERSGMGALQSH